MDGRLRPGIGSGGSRSGWVPPEIARKNAVDLSHEVFSWKSRRSLRRVFVLLPSKESDGRIRGLARGGGMNPGMTGTILSCPWLDRAVMGV